MKKILLLLTILITALAAKAQDLGLVVSIGTEGNMVNCSAYNTKVEGMLKNTADPNRTWTTYGFANNNGSWTYLATGHKSDNNFTAGYTAYISTDFAFDEAISKVEFKLTSRTAGTKDKFNVAYLQVADNKDMENAKRYDIDVSSFNTLAKNTQDTYSVEISTPATGMYYRLNFETQLSTNNGYIIFNEISYYAAVDGNTVTPPLYSIG